MQGKEARTARLAASDIYHADNQSPPLAFRTPMASCPYDAILCMYFTTSAPFADPNDVYRHNTHGSSSFTCAVIAFEVWSLPFPDSACAEGQQGRLQCIPAGSSESDSAKYLVKRANYQWRVATVTSDSPERPSPVPDICTRFNPNLVTCQLSDFDHVYSYSGHLISWQKDSLRVPSG